MGPRRSGLALASALALASLSTPLACGEKTPAPAPRPADAESGIRLPTPQTPDAGAATVAEADTAPATTSPPPVEPDATSATAPRPGAEPDSDWLVWTPRGDGWATRWIAVSGGEARVVAEVEAPVVTDGRTLWRLERADGRTDVLPCGCDDGVADAGGTECAAIGAVAAPNVAAVPLGGGEARLLREPAARKASRELTSGFELLGGVGATLIARESLGGDRCAAYNEDERSLEALDLGMGKPATGLVEDLGSRLPAAIRDAAAAALKAKLSACGEGDGVMDESRRFQVRAARLALDAEGGPKVVWTFGIWTGWTCDAGRDGFIETEVSSGLVPGAERLGLPHAPSPDAAAALRLVGEARTVGYGRLTLTGAERDAALAAFEAIAPAPWPPRVASMKPYTAPSAPDGPAPSEEDQRAARAALEDGRASLRKGDPASAIEEFSRGLERAPNDAKLLAERGYAYLLADRLDEADADMRRALPLEPSPDAQAAIWYNRGQVAEKRGQRDAALDAYEKSLALRPHPKVEAARDRVRAAAP